ncbi:ORF88R [black bullhead herpesvirus]|uniref:ORF88L n=1 Tax=black bullhead herpesvirus TaxID=508441 RepID=A0A2H5AJE8_9VIRU|nr:ORF88L [black bullhead herpesvirus]YP_009447907.1 ORF88R [black bullhead herpesvirus]AUG72259.1 ORF88L [black bullhead herpesvirus]AUG72329.1 ORF88R [black bullhead herpesvirus]
MASNMARAGHVHWCLQLFSELGPRDDDQSSSSSSSSGSSVSGDTPDWVSTILETSDDDLSSMPSPVSDRTSSAFSWASDDEEGDDDVFEAAPGGSWSERTPAEVEVRTPGSSDDEVVCLGVVEKVRLVREGGVWRVAERRVEAPTPYPWANPEEPTAEDFFTEFAEFDELDELAAAIANTPGSPSQYSPPSPDPSHHEDEYENPPSPTDYSPTSPRRESLDEEAPAYSPITSPEWDYETRASPRAPEVAEVAEVAPTRGFHMGPLLSDAWVSYEEYANDFIMDYRTLYHPHRDTPYSPDERRAGETPHGPYVPDSPVAGPSRKRGRKGETKGAPPKKKALVEGWDEDWEAELQRIRDGYMGTPITRHDLLPATVEICPISNCFFSGLKPEINGPTVCKCAICKHDGQCLCLARCARNCPDYECTCVDIATDNGRDPNPIFDPEDTRNFFIDECLAKGLTDEVASDLFTAKTLAFQIRNETRLKELDNA